MTVEPQGPLSPEEVTRRAPLFWISAAVGAAGIAWGLRGIFLHDGDTRPTNLAKFFAGGVIIHDAIFAPVVLLAGVGLARAVRGRARAYVQAALIITGCVTLFAYPEIRDFARVNHNPTSLPYNYTANAAAIALAIVVAIGVAAAGQRIAGVRRRRRPERR